jgi:hypoxanthine phosphoribosyltransferase
VLKGAVVFTADLLRAISLPAGLDFMGVSSYGSGAQSSGIVRLTADLAVSIEGRDVIIVEDIIDTGRTISYLRRNLATRHPRSLALCVLLDKVARREVEVPIDYVGFAIPDEFVVGYGLDTLDPPGHRRPRPACDCLGGAAWPPSVPVVYFWQ